MDLKSGLQILNILTIAKILVQLTPAFDYPFGGPNSIQARSWTTYWIQILYKASKKYSYNCVFTRFFYKIVAQFDLIKIIIFNYKFFY